MLKIDVAMLVIIFVHRRPMYVYVCLLNTLNICMHTYIIIIHLYAYIYILILEVQEGNCMYSIINFNPG